MAELSNDELQEIIDADLPGYRVVERVTDAEDTPPTKADSAGPDIAKLREKYLGEEEAENSESRSAGSGEPDTNEAPEPERADDESNRAAENTDDAIVIVEKTEMSDPHHGSRPKTVIVSGKDRRVVGSQG